MCLVYWVVDGNLTGEEFMNESELFALPEAIEIVEVECGIYYLYEDGEQHIHTTIFQ